MEEHTQKKSDSLNWLLSDFMWSLNLKFSSPSFSFTGYINGFSGHYTSVSFRAFVLLFDFLNAVMSASPSHLQRPPLIWGLIGGLNWCPKPGVSTLSINLTKEEPPPHTHTHTKTQSNRLGHFTK